MLSVKFIVGIFESPYHTSDFTHHHITPASTYLLGPSVVFPFVSIVWPATISSILVPTLNSFFSFFHWYIKSSLFLNNIYLVLSSLQFSQTQDHRAYLFFILYFCDCCLTLSFGLCIFSVIHKTCNINYSHCDWVDTMHCIVYRFE